MTEGNQQERPLVTFALFAFNQEKYIREAIEGAFSQTYEPLEIILSDDCSSDRTFEIMQEMAASYEGPHEVVIRKNEHNIGTIDHVVTVGKSCSGDLVVVAAGDDVSYSKRAEVVVKEWKKTRFSAFYSAADECGDKGDVISRGVLPEPLGRIQDLFEGCVAPIKWDDGVRNIPGYSAAYSRAFLELFPLCNVGALNEDALTTYAANLMGLIIHKSEESLVCRRLSDTSVSARSSFQSKEEIIKNEKVIATFARSTILFYDYFFRLGLAENSQDLEIVEKRLRRKDPYLDVVSCFWDVGPCGRVAMLFKSPSIAVIKYVLPRIFGVKLFSRIKFMVSKA